MNQPYHNRYGFLLLVCENFQRADTKTMCPQELCGGTIGSGGSPQGVRVLPFRRRRRNAMRYACPRWRTLSNPTFSAEFISFFICVFSTLTLCKFGAYFVLNWLCGVIALCENAGQISAELSMTVTSIRDGNFTLRFLPTRTEINAV